MEVKVKKTHPDAKIPFKTYGDDFCYDCVAVSRDEIAPNVFKYGLGLAFSINRGKGNPQLAEYVKGSLYKLYRNVSLNLSIDFRPRSSVWKTGMVLSNCQGTIDELYRGEVSAVFYRVLPGMPIYEVGDRIGQIKLGLTLPMEFVEVDLLDETPRGEAGYGSTGK